MIKKYVDELKRLSEEQNFWKWACIIALFVSNIMYLYLALCKTFHYDEAYSIGMAANGFSEIVEITSKDVHSPFYYFALKLFCMLPGVNDLIGAKLFSWVFILLYMIFCVMVVSRRYEWKVAFYWTVVSGFVPSIIIQSTTVRMYTMGLFFITVASYLAYSIYQQETVKKWIVFTIVGIVSVYTHTFCMLEMVLIYALLIIVALIKRNYKIVGKGLISGIVVSIFFLPWLYSLWQQFARWAGVESGWTSSFLPVSLDSAYVYLSEWFSSMEKPSQLSVIFWVALIIFASFHVRDYIKKSKDYLPVMGLILVGIMLVVSTLISNYVVPCFLGRYVLPLFAGVWLFVSIGIVKSENCVKQLVITVLILYFGVMAFRTEVEIEDETGLESYMQFIEAEVDFSKDVIMADRYFNSMFSIFYPEANYMVYGYAPDGLPFRNTEVFTEWEQLDGVDTVWFISFADNPGANIGEKYEAVSSFKFDYSYYKVKIEKMVRK